ncbi:MAG: PKD domain-containing protein [Candidatus Thermoplasmatota archaeon]|nr:PKD domain-containing protein [Candidatus Thermoplasmatota archaeon]
MKKMVICFYMLLIFYLLQITTISTSATTITLNPIEDSYVESDLEVDKNFGGGYSLEVTSGVEIGGDLVYHRVTFLKFDLSDLPSGISINSAKLELYLSSKNVDETFSLPVYYCSDNSWGELTLTYNNKPSWDSNSIDTCYQIAFNGQWYSWTITNAVKNAISNGKLTLVLDLEQQYSGVLTFNSKDSYKPPKLTITYEPANIAPAAGYSYSPSNPTIEDTIKFTDTSSDSDGTISLWSWNFGDGTTSTTKNSQHKYSAIGTYTVTLEVTDNDGVKKSISKTIVINPPEPPNNQPTPSFSFTPSTLTTDDTIQFIDASSDSDGWITAWLWNFGDGKTSTSQNPTHKYTNSGTFTVSLQVTDDDGSSIPTSKTLTVIQNIKPIADFIYPLSNLKVNESIQFTDNSQDSDGTIVEWSWNFGDGVTSTYQNPKHWYTKTGSYPVTLQVTDNNGGTHSKLVSIEIEKTSTPSFELIFVVIAMALVLLWKRKRIN